MNGPMMRLQRASAIAALSLLTWAATASAECSWIMWWGDRNPWQPVRAYSTLKACEADLPHGTSRTAWTCLPDTVAPRGPKGAK